MRLILAAALLLAPNTVAAEDYVVLRGLPKAPGVYYLELRISEIGGIDVNLVPPEKVVDLGSPHTPQPPADKFSDIRTAVRTATAAVEDENKEPEIKALSTMYSSLAGLPFYTTQSLHKSTDLMFAALGLSPSWQKWKATVTDALKSSAAIEAEGIETAKAAWAVVGAEVAK